VNTDSSGNLIGEQGHYPFGDSWYLNSTTTKEQFTTYERDSETGNDYAMARYYGSRLGRFLSVDPVAGNTSNPQSLNRYTYVLNDPINLIDPSGRDHCAWDDGSADDTEQNGGASQSQCESQGGTWMLMDEGSGGGNGGGGVTIIGDANGNVFVSVDINGTIPNLSSWDSLVFDTIMDGFSDGSAGPTLNQIRVLACKSSVISMFNNAWQAAGNGRPGVEAWFAITGSLNNPTFTPASPKFFNSVENKTALVPGALAYVHTHPNNREQIPSGPDTLSAAASMPVIVLSSHGANVTFGGVPQNIRPGGGTDGFNYLKPCPIFDPRLVGLI
jgi:RHS repeat-associated protein